MSSESLKYVLSNGFKSKDDLAFYFDFKDETLDDRVYATGGGSSWTGVIDNFDPSYDTGIHNAFLLNGTGSTISESTGNSVSFLGEKGIDLSLSNIMINKESFDFSSMSMVLGFEFEGEVSNGILFGSFEKEELQLPDSSYVTGAKGFNLGVTDRGNLFLQGYSNKGQFVEVIPKELSKKNYVGVSIKQGLFSLSVFDFCKKNQYTYTKNIDVSYFDEPESFYFGGSKEYFNQSEEEETTFDGYLNLAIGLDKYFTSSSLLDITRGALGEYFFNSGSSGEIVNNVLVDEVTIYKTGIIGYQLVQSGQLELQSSPQYLTGVITPSGSSIVQEGDKYQTFKQAINSSGERLFEYKQELGYIDSSSQGVYSPTGQDAQSILGLQDTGSEISGFIEQTGLFSESLFADLYEEIPLTGVLKEVSGVQYVYEDQTGYYTNPNTSGVSFSIDSEGLHKDYIYYMGPR